MANSVLMTISKDEEERARLMRDEKIELDYQSYMGHMKKKLCKYFLEKISTNCNIQISKDQLRKRIQKIIYEVLPEEICFKIVKQDYYGKPLEEILGDGLGTFLENHIIGHAEGRMEIINLLKSGMSAEEILAREWEQSDGRYSEN